MNKPNGPTENQHFVPRYLLRNFTDDKGRIWEFSTLLKKSKRRNGVKNIGTAHKFYDFPEKSSIRPKDDPLASKQVFHVLNTKIEATEPALLENTFFNKIDNEAAKILNNFVQKTKKITQKENKMFPINILNQEEKDDLAGILTIQAFRTKKFKDTLMELFLDFSQSKNVSVNLVDKDDSIILAKYGLYNKILFNRISDLFINYIWKICFNNSNQPFFISDNPVVMQPHLKSSDYSYKGRLELNEGAGTEVVCPLTSDIILIMRDRSYFSEDANNENKLVLLSIEEVNNYNKLQVLQCDKKFFCKEDKFDLAKKIYNC
ncbi:DUF4238 domain-containing protein [Argonema galeatum]|uniref:DUF4238 domain-containing protein n=1 Tax=Argonema galeatum TaxID=2942762 RepID=UPI00201135E3|nr:DUF4238 domain-containing protein [Argonema galeatum]MCL1468905.1 DUF4238 domain-containing protein [Argonema galeatum A003/A1]